MFKLLITITLLTIASIILIPNLTFRAYLFLKKYSLIFILIPQVAYIHIREWDKQFKN